MEVTPKKVLVAEPDEIVLVLISHVLSRYAYSVHRSTTASETEAMLSTTDYDVVLLASTLPDGGDGFIRRMLDVKPALQQKVIVLTNGDGDAAERERNRVHAVMRKPVEIYHLLETVRDCAARK